MATHRFGVQELVKNVFAMATPKHAILTLETALTVPEIPLDLSVRNVWTPSMEMPLSSSAQVRLSIETSFVNILC